MSATAEKLPILERLLTPAEASQLLTLAPSTLAEYRSSGKGPKFVRLSQNKIVYKVSDVLEYIASQESTDPKSEVTANE